LGIKAEFSTFTSQGISYWPA